VLLVPIFRPNEVEGLASASVIFMRTKSKALPPAHTVSMSTLAQPLRTSPAKHMRARATAHIEEINAFMQRWRRVKAALAAPT
jgi:hypothetical protein